MIAFLALAALLSLAPPPAAAGAARERRVGMSGVGMYGKVVKPSDPPVLGISVKDFGAKGDGVTDDTAALQKAIDTAASAASPRALLFPAGTYAVSSPIVVPNTHDSGVASVRLVGEGPRLSSIKALAAMDAMVFFNSSVPLRQAKPVAGVTTNGHEVRNIGFNGADLVNHTVYAPALTRSTFHNSAFSGGLRAGLRFGYGWINTVEGCQFNGNGLVALHMADNINNVNVVDCLFEGNHGLGVVANEGVQVRITGNVFESLGAPAIFVRGVESVAVVDNYFEADDDAPKPSVVFVNETTGELIELCAEIVLDGAAQQGEAPYQYTLDPTNISLGSSSALVKSAVVSGNYHNGGATASPGCAVEYDGIAATGAAMVIVEANSCLGCGRHHANQVCRQAVGPNVTDPELFRLSMNSGWAAADR